MNFQSILHAAKQNNSNNKSSKNFYATKYPPSKKLQSNQAELSGNVKRFLAKKEEEEKKKKEDDERRRQELLYLRSQDTKSKKRVSLMLKSTKSASKAAIADARDDNNTAVTMLGPSQPDEDDYGYTSKEASEFYDKIMNKYNSAPPEPDKFSKKQKTSVKNAKQICEAKDRVRQALEREREAELLPHRRKRRPKEPTEQAVDSNDEEVEEPPPPPKQKKLAPPPPIDFHELLRIAEQKKNEPIKFEPKVAPKPEEDERPMTKRERKEYERQKQWRESRESRMKQESVQKVESPPPAKQPAKIGRIPKKNAPEVHKASTSNAYRDQAPPKQQSPPSKPSSSNVKSAIGKPTGREIPAKPAPGKVQMQNNVKNTKVKDGSLKPVAGSSMAKGVDAMGKISKERRAELEKEIEIQKRNTQNLIAQLEKLDKAKQRDSNQAGSAKAPVVSRDGPGDRRIDTVKRNTENKRLEPPTKGKVPQGQGAKVESVKPAPPQRPANDRKVAVRPGGVPAGPTKPFPTSQNRRPLGPGHSQGSSRPGPARPLQGPGKKKPPPMKRRIESDSEYDSELDDFIDDGPEEETPENVSEVIKNLFNYDKTKYNNMDDDDECMESNFAQQQREEFISTKHGILEDLEDIKKEQMEKKKKAMLSKKRARK